MRDMKDSGVLWIGEIPVDWNLQQGKYVYKIETGKLDVNAEDFDGIYPFFTCSMHPRRINTYAFDCEALLVAGNGIVGYTQYYKGKFNAYQRTYVLSNFKGVQTDYLKYYISNNLMIDVSQKSIGSVIQFIKLGDLRNFVIAFPNETLQKRIVAVLDQQCDQLNALIQNVEKQIEKLKVYKQSVITEVVTKGLDPSIPMKDSEVEWMANVPAHWEIRPSKFLFENCDERRREGDVQLTASQKYGMISQEEYMRRENARIVLADKGLENWKHIEPFDFVISLRSFQGGLEMSEVSGCATWHYIVLRARQQIHPYYFKWLFKSSMYITALQRTCNYIRDGQDLRYSNFVKVPLCIPTIEEQYSIADYLDKKCAQIDQLITIKQKKIDKLNEYKKSLIYEYVTGKKEVS